jgi:ribosome-associated protein
VSTHIVPLREIRFRTSRSGGPGGQNVNKLETRVEASWDFESSATLTDEERARLRTTFHRRLTVDGAIRVVSQRYRSQRQNREAAVERLRALVAAALAPRKKRRSTRPSANAVARRLEEKKRRGSIKRERGHIEE